MKKKLSLKDVYEISYGSGLPFQKKRDSGVFLVVSMLSNFVEANKEDKLSIWDCYFYLLDELGITLGDFATYASEALKKVNIDALLYQNFYDDILFEHCLEYSDFMLSKLGVKISDCLESPENFLCGLFPTILGKDFFLNIAGKMRQKSLTLDGMGDDEEPSKLMEYVNLLFDNKVNKEMFSKRLSEFVKRTLLDKKSLLKFRRSFLLSAPENLIEKIENALNTENSDTQEDKEKRLEAVREKTKQEPTVFDASKLENVSAISDRVIGQEFALAKIQNNILCTSVGFRNEKQPIASFLLTGPTGVGKTETAKAVADACFDGKFFVVDMSTFKNDIDVSRLLGGSPNYVGYNDPPAFCKFLKENPCSVILFDEIEKGHPDCLDLLMRILDEGEFINAKGEKITLKDTVIFCTTNLTQNKPKTVGFNKEEILVEEEVVGAMGIRKELAGRFTEIIEYRQLSKQSCKKIAKEIFLKEILDNFKRNNNDNIKIVCTDDFLDLVVEKANTNLFGARDIKKSLKANLVGPVSKFILENRPKNSTIIVSANDIKIKDKYENLTNNKNNTDGRNS